MLRIIRDRDFLSDKNATLFIKALIKECDNNNIECEVLSINNIEVAKELSKDILTPTILIDPMNKEYKELFKHCYDIDSNTTAKVCCELIKDIKTCSVLLIGRGNIGLKLSEFILTKTNHTLTVVNSHTEEGYIQYLIDNSDIVINTATSVIEVNKHISMGDKIIIDINNNLKMSSANDILKYCNMKDIGRLTVKEIVSRVKSTY